MRHLFARDVTRAIPPVVYFHEQDPHKVMAEVDEYIVTGGYAASDHNHKRVPIGIHEQYVALLRGILAELDTPGGPSLPTAWISGFYGSGKSSFAKLIGLALDAHPGFVLPDDRPLSAALIARDKSVNAHDFAAAFAALRARIKPVSVVFDIGGTARNHEHIHMVAVRQLQHRLGYCRTFPAVATFELRLERDGEYARFLETAERVLGRPWSELRDTSLAETHFSLVLSHLFPNHFPTPTAWSRSLRTSQSDDSPQDATFAMRDMLSFRAPDATLFLVVDEVSQYVIGHADRIDRLRAFATELGSVMKGRIWLIALGQQKLDEGADQNHLGWMKDRFPPKLRLHLAPTNIRDVIHRRLLAKTPEAEATLRDLFAAQRSQLAQYAYAAAELTPADFVEVYPLLPNHIDLLLQITSAMRQRTSRAQGDDHGIRGVLQLLGELFRSQGLADAPVGTLVTFDRVYEIMHTALDSDLQASMARVLAQTVNLDPLHLQCAKVVALLEHIQENLPTTAELVASCLYDRLDRGDRVAEVKAALEVLKNKNLLGHGEKTGYKIQSSSAEEWEQEKQRLGHTRDQLAELVKDALTRIPAALKPRLGKRDFPWKTSFATRLKDDGQLLVDPRDQAAVAVDYRWLPKDESLDAQWITRSAEVTLATRIIWVAGDDAQVVDVARDLARSRDMVARYQSRRDSLVSAKKHLLLHEEVRSEELDKALVTALGQQLIAGRIYFSGRGIDPREHGQAPGPVLTAVANRLLPEIYKDFESVDVQPSHIKQIIDDNLNGMTRQFMEGPLQLFDLDAGKIVASGSGKVPTRLLDEVKKRSGMSGSALLQHFAAPPFAWTSYMVMAAVAGLVRAQRLEIQLDDGTKVTRLSEPGVRDLFEKDRGFRAADFFVANEPPDPRVRNRIAKVLEDGLDGVSVEREEDRIVDAIGKHMPLVARRARDILARHARIGIGGGAQLGEIERLALSAEKLATGSRYTAPTMKTVQMDLDVLRDGFQALKTLESELTEPVAASLIEARRVLRAQGAQLGHMPGLSAALPEVAAAVETITSALAAQRPWREIDAVRAATLTLTEAYRAERARLLAWQESEVDRVKAELRASVEFARLNDDGKNAVMRVFARLNSGTTADALSPELLALGAPFSKLLAEVEEQALDVLDELGRAAVRAAAAVATRDRPIGAPVIVERPPSPMVSHDLKLKNRVVTNAAEVETLVGEIRDQLLNLVQSGKRVRLK